MPNVTFGHGGEVDSGFLQQVSYDERDWFFNTSTPTTGSGPSEDYTEGDTDGLFAYLEGNCDPGERHTACESERVSMHQYCMYKRNLIFIILAYHIHSYSYTYIVAKLYILLLPIDHCSRPFLRHHVFHLDLNVYSHLPTTYTLLFMTHICWIWVYWRLMCGMMECGIKCSVKEEGTIMIPGIQAILIYQ